MPPSSMTSRDIIPLAMPMALLAALKAEFCKGIGCWFGSGTGSQFFQGSQSGTFDFFGTSCQILGWTSNGVCIAIINRFVTLGGFL